MDLVERGATVLHRRSATSVFRVEHGPEATTLHLADFSTLTIPRGHRVPVVELRKELHGGQGQGHHRAAPRRKPHPGPSRCDGYGHRLPDLQQGQGRPHLRRREGRARGGDDGAERRRTYNITGTIDGKTYSIERPEPRRLDRTASEGGVPREATSLVPSSSTKETVALHRAGGDIERDRERRLEPPSLRGHRPRSSRGRRHRRGDGVGYDHSHVRVYPA